MTELSGNTLDSVRILIRRQDLERLKSCSFSSVTLDAAFEFACAYLDAPLLERYAFETLAETLVSSHPTIDAAIRTLQSQSSPTESDFSAPSEEIVAGVVLLNEISSSFFFKRFVRTMQAHGVSRVLANTVAGGFREMADNVVWHSTNEECVLARSIIGFRVTPQTVTYAVADIGRGLLASLRSSPRWAALKDSLEALRTAVMLHATRRPGFVEGGGFRTVQQSVAGLPALCRFRTGDQVLRLDTRDYKLDQNFRSSPVISGLQLAVSFQIGA